MVSELVESVYVFDEERIEIIWKFEDGLGKTVEVIKGKQWYLILGEFCDFTKVPDAPKPTRFKQDYLLDLQSVYDNFFDINWTDMPKNWY